MFTGSVSQVGQTSLISRVSPAVTASDNEVLSQTLSAAVEDTEAICVVVVLFVKRFITHASPLPAVTGHKAVT